MQTPALNLIDLISEKHALLRKKVILAWEATGEEAISDTESYFLAIVEREQVSIAQIARIIGISRQGAHKCAKGLIERGYVLLDEDSPHVRNTPLLLTAKGQHFCAETLKIKLAMQAEIEHLLGPTVYASLYESLNLEW